MPPWSRGISAEFKYFRCCSFKSSSSDASNLSLFLLLENSGRALSSPGVALQRWSLFAANMLQVCSSLFIKSAADASKATGVRHTRHLLRGCAMFKESSSLLQADRRVMMKQWAVSVGFFWLRKESGGYKPFLVSERWPVEDLCFIDVKHIGRVNVKKHTPGDRGQPSISPRCYPRERERRAPGRRESVLCPSTTIPPPPPPPKKKKKGKKMAFILGGRSSQRPWQAWPASWRKCRLSTKPHTWRKRQTVRLLAPLPRRRFDGGWGVELVLFLDIA